MVAFCNTSKRCGLNLDRHWQRSDLASIVAWHMQLSKGTVSAADTLRLNTLSPKDAVGDSGTVTIITQSQHLLATEDGHQSLGAGVTVAILVLDGKQSLKLKPQLLEHGAVVCRIGKWTAARSTISQCIEGNVDRVGQVEGVIVGRASEVEKLCVGRRGEGLVDLSGQREDSVVSTQRVNGKVAGQGSQSVELPGIVVSVEVNISQALITVSDDSTGV